ncbi:TetR family transcriptional regulator [Nocardioides luteus]|uniref:TetR family transcriptional regulator n=2 Tax=Nocardioides luteus TaxID=1844 RepID=A0A1J4N5T2_9ACTN|nr:TetR family transcriptional regulator [Nocardioides luteus]
MTCMTPPRQRSVRRADALSTDRIVEAAIEILDAEGERGLTFRALAARLSTGAGAIYHHVASKEELLTEATTGVIERVLADVPDSATPEEGARAITLIALGMFDAIDEHPWVGAHLPVVPWQPGMVRLFESIGGRLDSLGVPESAQFNAASALLNYILGVAAQNAANARTRVAGAGREEFMAETADRWEQLSPASYPFLHRVARQLRHHDDREQFLAGVDLVLAGLAAGQDG